MTALAIDLGTTNLSLSLSDETTGARLGFGLTPNPQGVLGADVMTRLLRAHEAESSALELRRLAVGAIADLLTEVCGGFGLSSQQVTRVAIVGNSAMLALLTGDGFHRLLDPATWMTPARAPSFPADQWRERWQLAPSATIDVVAALGGFVGSDLLAGMVHTRLGGETIGAVRPGLLIDFGTNSEIALWDGYRYLVSSAAGGPAFEGVGIRGGMPAVAGAVCTVGHDAGEWNYRTVDDHAPRGICATGLVDLMAILREGAQLSAVGRLASGTFELPGTSFSIGNHDIDLFQRAKAAIGAGCQTLCKSSDLALHDVESLYIAGAFGSFLDVRHGVAVGLLPPLDPARVSACGNAALAGCEDLLLRPESAALAERIRGDVQVVNLAAVASFETLYFEHLYLRPGAAWSRHSGVTADLAQ